MNYNNLLIAICHIIKSLNILEKLLLNRFPDRFPDELADLPTRYRITRRNIELPYELL